MGNNSNIDNERGGGGGRRMMTLVIFLMGNNSNIDDEGGGRVQKSHFRDDVICERSLTASNEQVDTNTSIV